MFFKTEKRPLSEPLIGPPPVAELPCRPTLLLGLPDWTIPHLTHVLINDLVYANTSRYRDSSSSFTKELPDTSVLKTLSYLDGEELVRLTKSYGGTVIVAKDDVLDQDTAQVDSRLMERLRGQDFQAIVVDDTYFVRKPEITNFVAEQYNKGVAIVIMAIEGIFDLSALRQNFDVNWRLSAYTKRSIKLTQKGNELLGKGAFPFDHEYVKANFVVGKEGEELFTEHQFPGDYDDEEDYPNGPPPPEPGSPIVCSINMKNRAKQKAVSYFGFVNFLDVSYGALIQKLCYVVTNENVSFAGLPGVSVHQSLDLDDVKNLAKLEGLKLISFSEKSRVISFRKSIGNVRINVYWTTGTVGTCLDHPRQGKTQLFRRNVNLRTLREIFQDPRVHTGSGYHTKEYAKQYNEPRKFCIGDRAHIRGYADCTILSQIQTSGSYKGKVKIRYDDYQTYHVDYEQLEEVSKIHDDDQCLTLENEAKLQLERLDNELQNIQNERIRVKEILHDIEEKRELERKRKEAEEKAERERIAEKKREELKRKEAEEKAERERIAEKKREELKRKTEAEAEAERERIAKKLREEKMLLDSKRTERGKFIDYCLCEGILAPKSKQVPLAKAA